MKETSSPSVDGDPLVRATSGSCRRQFIGSVLAATAAGAWWRALAAEHQLAFIVAGKEFTFDTGALRGTLRSGARSRGLTPVFDRATSTQLAKPNGLFSFYRMLDDTQRYGNAAWDWASEATLLEEGAVEVRWTADDAHPFDLGAVYRWSAPGVLDLTTRVTARKELRRFEVFLASYFEGFPTTVVYAGGRPAFLGASKEAGKWQMFPRDAAAARMIHDGRWKHPPSPVEWTIRPKYAAPLAVRRDAERGLAAVLMTRAEECFAVAAPCDEESHRSVYFSLFGRDLRRNESAVTRSRLWIGRDLPDEKVAELYEKFRNQDKKT